MERRITRWEYPYSLRIFARNVRMYGLVSSLKHDWSRTKENTRLGLENIAENASRDVITIMAIPLAIYVAYKLIKDVSSSQKKRREQLESQEIQSLK